MGMAQFFRALRPFIPDGPQRELYDAAMCAWLPTAYKLPFPAPAPADTERVAKDPDDQVPVAKDPVDKERVATKDPADMGGDMGRVDTGRSTKTQRRAKRAAQSRPAGKPLSSNTKAPEEKGRVATDPVGTGRSTKVRKHAKRAAQSRFADQ